MCVVGFFEVVVQYVLVLVWISVVCTGDGELSRALRLLHSAGIALLLDTRLIYNTLFYYTGLMAISSSRLTRYGQLQWRPEFRYDGLCSQPSKAMYFATRASMVLWRRLVDPFNGAVEKGGIGAPPWKSSQYLVGPPASSTSQWGNEGSSGSGSLWAQ